MRWRRRRARIGATNGTAESLIDATAAVAINVCRRRRSRRASPAAGASKPPAPTGALWRAGSIAASPTSAAAVPAACRIHRRRRWRRTPFLATRSPPPAAGSSTRRCEPTCSARWPVRRLKETLPPRSAARWRPWRTRRPRCGSIASRRSEARISWIRSKACSPTLQTRRRYDEAAAAAQVQPPLACASSCSTISRIEIAPPRRAPARSPISSSTRRSTWSPLP